MPGPYLLEAPSTGRRRFHEFGVTAKWKPLLP